MIVLLLAFSVILTSGCTGHYLIPHGDGTYTRVHTHPPDKKCVMSKSDEEKKRFCMWDVKK